MVVGLTIELQVGCSTYAVIVAAQGLLGNAKNDKWMKKVAVGEYHHADTLLRVYQVYLSLKS